MKRYRTLPFFIGGSLLVASMPMWAGPIRNPERIDVYRYTNDDRRVLVWYASPLTMADLGITPEIVNESSAVLRESRLLAENNGRITPKGWRFLAGINETERSWK